MAGRKGGMMEKKNSPKQTNNRGRNSDKQEGRGADANYPLAWSLEAIRKKTERRKQLGNDVIKVRHKQM